ncbi:ParA family protein [Piscirickettsia salmonis]|uniref:ParA family protein n=1 Tax=Piscirickettsia salmonis TaxID=1238 RepID=UPI002352D502|nr:ParA family protein [Piscirickettsia salmonis]
MEKARVNTTAMQKGGVGKTTYVFNLAHGLASKGYRILVVDNDPQGDLTQAMLGHDVSPQCHTIELYDNKKTTPQAIKENIHLIGADIELALAQERSFEIMFDFADQIQRLKKKYDYILIDSLPSFGTMHTASLLAADTITIPTKAAPFSLKAVKMLMETINKVKRPRMNPQLEILGILINYVEGSQTSLGRELEKTLRDHYGETIFKNKLTRTVKIEEAAEEFNLIVDEFLIRDKQAFERVTHYA